jgi:hypothetical protein
LTGGVVVRPVRTAADLNRFIAFPYHLHRGDPLWVPPLRMDIRKLLSREKNPFFRHSAAEYFLAGREVVVGRIAAIHNRAHTDFHGDSTGFFGFFECVDDQDVADALFAAAGAWLTARGLTVMRGPASFSTNDECGLLVEGFDTPPTLLNPHNPPYYVQLVERAGFVKARDLFQYQSTNPALPERLVRGAQLLAERKHIKLRRLDMKRFDEEIERVKRVYNAAWEKNWGFVPLTDAEIDHLAKQLKPVIVPDLVVFAERNGEVIGFGAALPDLNVALKRNPSGRLFPGILKVLWAARKIDRVRILLLGVLKEYRKSGADALMYHWIWEKGNALGYYWGEAGWILEENVAMINAAEQLGFRQYKTLRLYDRPL